MNILFLLLVIACLAGLYLFFENRELRRKLDIADNNDVRGKDGRYTGDKK